ncbi:MAG: SDR family oxidoreductase [Sphingomonadales bacterium]|jgi:NAD(P)-dependent dehydrogenase (short-subunit alcohol dehydrogenase family)
MFQKDLFKGKKILVTGGGTGLGRSMTEKYLELGAEVVIWGRRLNVLEETAAELGGPVTVQAVDIRDPEAIEAAVAEIWEQGPLSGLVNNAAGNFISPTENLSANAFNAIASIVFNGTFNVTNAVGKRWLKDGLKGNILSIVTTWVWTGSPFVVPSAMSKAGVAAMTQSLAVEWGPRGIRANAIAPGPFPTKGAWDRLMPQNAKGSVRDGEEGVPLRRYGKHEELANLAAFLMADQSEYITGAIIPIDGGQYLNSAGNFAGLSSLSPEDWQAVRDQIQTSNAKDKAERTAS